MEQQSGAMAELQARVATKKPKPHLVNKSLGKRNLRLWREESFVVDQILHPAHQHVNVLWRRQQGRLLVLAVVLPVVLILGPTAHLGARLVGAKVAYGAVDEVDAVEKVHRCRGREGGKKRTQLRVNSLVSLTPNKHRKWGARQQRTKAKCLRIHLIPLSITSPPLQPRAAPILNLHATSWPTWAAVSSSGRAKTASGTHRAWPATR